MGLRRVSKLIGKKTKDGKQKDHIDLIYDKLAVKDLTHRQFRKEYMRVTNPNTAASELDTMVQQRGLRTEIARQVKGQIDGR